MYEKKIVKMAVYCAKQDIAKSTDFVPPEIKTRGMREAYRLYVSVSIRLQSQPLHPPESSDFTGEEVGSLSRPGKEPPLLQLAAEAQFGGFLINLSRQMLYDKMVKIGGRSGGGGVKVHFAKQTNSESLDFTNYPTLWLFRPLFFPPISI